MRFKEHSNAVALPYSHRATGYRQVRAARRRTPLIFDKTLVAMVIEMVNGGGRGEQV